MVKFLLYVAGLPVSALTMTPGAHVTGNFVFVCIAYSIPYPSAVHNAKFLESYRRRAAGKRPAGP